MGKDPLHWLLHCLLRAQRARRTVKCGGRGLRHLFGCGGVGSDSSARASANHTSAAGLGLVRLGITYASAHMRRRCGLVMGCREVCVMKISRAQSA